MARTRTSKRLAQRFDREYFKKPHPFRTWRRRLSLIAVLLSLGGVAWGLMPARRMVWSKGALSPAHTFLRDDCGACHGPPRVSAALLASTAGKIASDELIPLKRAPTGRGGVVTDEACASCHRGTVHHANQAAATACASCHGEHGGALPGAVSDDRCTGCHAALVTTSGPPKTAAAVTTFPGGHPEFRAVAQHRDPGGLLLNHEVHLWAGLRAPDGRPVRLTCSSCHAPDRVGGGFLPVKYEPHCQGCHTLALKDPRLQGPVPLSHGDLTATSRELAAAFAGAGQGAAAAALAQVRTKECGRCHESGGAPTGGPAAARLTVAGVASLAPAAVPATWMPNAIFDHRSHRALGCAACHGEVEKSRRTADVLLPGKEACAACHSPKVGASSECRTCHRYHPEEGDRLGPSLFGLP
jgi:hypothetical protein